MSTDRRDVAVAPVAFPVVSSQKLLHCTTSITVAHNHDPYVPCKHISPAPGKAAGSMLDQVTDGRVSGELESILPAFRAAMQVPGRGNEVHVFSTLQTPSREPHARRPRTGHDLALQHVLVRPSEITVANVDSVLSRPLDDRLTG